MPLGNLIARRADNQCAPRVDGRKERIAILEAMFEVREGFVELFDEPVEFAVLLWRRRIGMD